ncbi:VOC family protein [Mesobacillus subterraneus]|uniref:Glyoxalase/bleomycin resistance/dioxygenase family protein n=1 Tax=Mesobacillus subterraneus TaxID=285983 RepID=A0A427TM03_9BACI|nr:VOC family protein [Mesobacillus subterraneus]RSD25386.1 glyoxalase/bleomycin resistance/dioxygenase family protein [Mesobacillus subterraneus]
MRIHHYALEVANLAASITFYKSIIGFQESSKVLFQGEEIFFLDLDGFKLELLKKQTKQGLQSNVHLCFEVDHLERKIEELKILNLHPIEGPYHLETGWKTVFYNGPDNEIIEILQTK